MSLDIYLNQIHLPSSGSHKGQNGRLLIIGGSHLFHSASLWALEVAGRMVDLVHYSSVSENNRIVAKLKEEFRNGIVVPRAEIENYIEEDDCILIGPGMTRATSAEIFNFQFSIFNLKEILKIKNEGVQTYYLTKYLLQKYPHKKWVIDAGALQMLDPGWIPDNAILTPHQKEFDNLILRTKNLEPRSHCKTYLSSPTRSGIFKIPAFAGMTKRGFVTDSRTLSIEEQVKLFAETCNCVVLLKGEKDIIASKDKLEIIKGGNAGMTKGGTGDVLAGLVAGLYCENDAFTSAVCASYINKKAGEELFEKKGFWFNASDLSDQIPGTMKKLLL